MNDPIEQPPDGPPLPPEAPDSGGNLNLSPLEPRGERLIKYLVASGVFGFFYLVLIVVGGSAREFAFSGLEPVPFVILAVLAYEARPGDGSRAVAIAFWVLLIGMMGLLMWLITITVLTSPLSVPRTNLELGLRIGGAFLGVALAGIAAAACFLPPVRRAAARFIDIDPGSFVHATALATTVGASLILLIPLLALDDPPLLSPGAAPLKAPADEVLRGMLFTLIWSVPASFMAVGYPGIRAFGAARERLGLSLPGWRELAGAVVAIGVLLFGVTYLDQGVAWLWETMGWNVTDVDAVMALFQFGVGPVAALIVGVSAGLGEELVFRGVLQPRLGIVLPALMFAAAHAFQYNFDSLFQVFLLGLIFGVIRKWTNTTTCALIHGGYDFVALMAVYLGY